MTLPKVTATLAAIVFLLTIATEGMAFGFPSNDEAAREPTGRAQRLGEQELAQAQNQNALQEQNELDQALDDHNQRIAQIQNWIESETNVGHPRRLASIDEEDKNVPDQKVVDIDAENLKSKNFLDSCQRKIALENQRYQVKQYEIKARYSGTSDSGVKTESLQLQEQQQLNQAADNDDASKEQIAKEADEETYVRHPRNVASIIKDDANVPDQKKVDLANEMRLFKNNLQSFAHALGLENAQYQLTINGIKSNFSAQISGGGGGGGQSPAPLAPSAAPSAVPSAQPTSHP